YRLHTPAEVSKRNHVTRYEVLRDVIIQQIIQTIFGYSIAYFDPPEMTGKNEYNAASWARTIRVAQAYIPSALAVVGVNAPRLANNLHDAFPTLASVLAGGAYSTSGFQAWEMLSAKLIYYVAIQAVQFTIAISIVDTWQYFLHRAMHMNKFLYTTLHSRHHRLYVPYAYGALYNHPVEGFVLDTLGTGLAYLVTGMTVRQGMVFFTCSTIKTVDDHCGYAFPWDPLQHFTENNAAYHDIHHQSWGIKTNFSQPFFTFWDRILETNWKGGDVSARYARDKANAQKRIDADNKNNMQYGITNPEDVDLKKAKEQMQEGREWVLSKHGPEVIEEEKREEREARQRAASVKKPVPRRKSTGLGFDPVSALSNSVPSLHGKSTPVIHPSGIQAA
ncbi:Sphingolipid C4-hydroxylase sur2, partial [Elasticomyces elasticus]